MSVPHQIVLKLTNLPPKTRHRTPVLFISGFSKAAYKYFNFFGPWTAFVQGPLINLCVMNVKMTVSADLPVNHRVPHPHARAPRSLRPASGKNLKFLELFSLFCPGLFRAKSQVSDSEQFNNLTN